METVFAHDSLHRGQKELALWVYEACLSRETLVIKTTTGLAPRPPGTNAFMAQEGIGRQGLHTPRFRGARGRVLGLLGLTISPFRKAIFAAAPSSPWMPLILTRLTEVPDSSTISITA